MAERSVEPSFSSVPARFGTDSAAFHPGVERLRVGMRKSCSSVFPDRRAGRAGTPISTAAIVSILIFGSPIIHREFSALRSRACSRHSIRA